MLIKKTRVINGQPKLFRDGIATAKQSMVLCFFRNVGFVPWIWLFNNGYRLNFFIG